MHPLSVRAVTALGLFALAAIPSVARRAAGADTPARATGADTLSREQYERRIEQLENDLKDLKKDTRKLEVAGEEQAKLKPIAGWQDGFFIQSPDGNNKLNIGGYVHYDSRFFLDEGDQGTTQFTFRRVRLDVRGTFLKYFDFRVMPDFAGGRVQLFDAYLNTKYFPYAQVQVGKYKPPVGLERLQSATALLFAERALPTSLVPSRDLGAMLHGELFNKALGYQVGIFDGVPDGVNNATDNDINDEKTFAGRIFAHPFKDTPLVPLRGLGFGVSGTYGKEKGSVSNTDLPSYRTFGQQTFFSYVTDNPATADGTAIARGDQSRVSPQGYWYWGPFGSMFEYAWSEQEVRKGAVQEPVQADAWQVAASWVLTGEDATYKGVVPARPFNPLDRSGWGAFQVAARGSQLHVDQEAFENGFASPSRSASKATEFAIGANWYWNRNVLLALDFALTTFNGGRQGGDRKKEEVILSRVQFLL